MTVIANIDSVSLYDALDVGNPWLKMYEKRYDGFCLPGSGLPERQGSKMASVTGEGIACEVYACRVSARKITFSKSPRFQSHTT